MSCAYCEVKKANKQKVFAGIAEAGSKGKAFKCEECGSWIDAGQVSVRVNGYSDIYKGALRLIDGIVNEFNHILADLQIDLGEYYGLDGQYELDVYSSDIIDKLFLPYYGSTTKSNFANVIGVEEHSHTWKLSREEYEEE